MNCVEIGILEMEIGALVTGPDLKAFTCGSDYYVIRQVRHAPTRQVGLACGGVKWGVYSTVQYIRRIHVVRLFGNSPVRNRLRLPHSVTFVWNTHGAHAALWLSDELRDTVGSPPCPFLFVYTQRQVAIAAVIPGVVSREPTVATLIS